MKITLNGSVTETDQSNLLDLVVEQGLDSQSLVIEHNQLVVRQDDWQATSLCEGDSIELLHFVGGG